MSHGKMPDFVSFLLCRFTVVLKLKNFDLESQIGICPIEKMSDLISFPLFRFTLVMKLRNFDFESY